MTKQELRVEIQTKRLKLELTDYLFLSKKITDRVIFESFKSKKSIHIFIGMAEKREINTLPVVIEALRRGIEVWAPVIRPDKKFVHGRIKSIDDLEEGPFGLTQPKAESEFPETELVFVPGLGFTKRGDRLGWGKGYYDGFLTEIKDKTGFSGLCFDFQVLEEIPVEPWDVKMTQIITESGIIQCEG
ncbi:MAG: 5-formyltetrahydrofolate cyclo-ligase [Bacteroidetes bacterium]|nr:5-formyltetrahydrofolate cyclo-ligase [Bacteroidota bacterium]